MVKTKQKYYGYVTSSDYGICCSWSECQSKTTGKSKSKYKSFPTEDEAITFVKEIIESRNETFVMDKVKRNTEDQGATKDQDIAQTGKQPLIGSDTTVPEQHHNSTTKDFHDETDDDVNFSENHDQDNEDSFNDTIDSSVLDESMENNIRETLESMRKEIQNLRSDVELIKIHADEKCHSVNSSRDEFVLEKKELENANFLLECTVKELREQLQQNMHAKDLEISSLQNRLKQTQDENASLTEVVKVLGRDLHETQINSTSTSTDSRLRHEDKDLQSQTTNDFVQPNSQPTKQRKQNNRKTNTPNYKPVHTRTSPFNTQNRFETLSTHPTNNGAQSKSNAQRTSSIPTIIIGDSMIKDLRGWKMSKNSQIKVRSFSGSTVEAMAHYVKPAIEEKPGRIILHVGTNNIKSCSPRYIADKIVDIGNSIGSDLPETKVVISGLITRNDDSTLLPKIAETNKILLKFCNQNNWSFIDNSAMENSHLNKGGLHLNKTGTINLAKNIIANIKCVN